MANIEIRALSTSPRICDMLGETLVEAVADGASVTFMYPLAADRARAFWTGALASADRGERVILGAWDGELLVGTVTLQLDVPQNQQHRAEIAKLMTRISHRGRGVAVALMRAAETEAVKRGRTLLVLDTASDGGASPLYERLGFVFAGAIPDFARTPHGELTATRIYYKRIGSNPSP
jgi:ribosomal protein S18 acetylase RimI-like enzyme